MGNYSHARLLSIGLTNQGLGFTLGDVSSPAYVFTGVCSGFVQKEFKTKTGEPKMKEVDCLFTTINRSIDRCPECGYNLFWKKQAQV